MRLLVSHMIGQLHEAFDERERERAIIPDFGDSTSIRSSGERETIPSLVREQQQEKKRHVIMTLRNIIR